MYSIILTPESNLAEKQKTLFHYLAQFGYQDFLKIESVISNKFYGQIHRQYIKDELVNVSLHCQRLELHTKCEEIELDYIQCIKIDDLVIQMNNGHLILINFNEAIKIVEFKFIENLYYKIL